MSFSDIQIDSTYHADTDSYTYKFYWVEGDMYPNVARVSMELAQSHLHEYFSFHEKYVTIGNIEAEIIGTDHIRAIYYIKRIPEVEAV